MGHNRQKWGSGSVPGSLSDKYRAVRRTSQEELHDSYEEDIGNNKPDNHIIKKGLGSKGKSGLPINDDGVITTISQQQADHDDRCSSIMSLSDKYRNQEEIEIFQVTGNKLKTT